MRIVHTSDWHAGRVWKGINRLPELERVLDNLATYIEGERIDIMLMSGDVFETTAPSADADRVVFQFLKRVGMAKVQSVVIGGNHDNAVRLEAWGTLAELVGVRTVGLPRRREAGGLLDIVTPHGRALVAAVPFASPGRLVSGQMLGRSDTASAQRYAEAMQSILTHLTDGFSAEAVNVVVAHTHVSGAVLATHDRSERSVHLGDDWAVSPQAFPASASYVALGHIHKPQDLPAAVARTCYAGSALQLDFGEAGEEKSFVVIDVEPRRPPQVSRVPYQGGTPLVDLTLASVQELRSRAGDLATDEAYLRVTVTDSTEAHDLNREVRELLPNAVAVRVPETDPSEDENESSIDRSLLSPRQLYAVYCRRTRSQEPGEALLDEFDILHRDAGGR